MRRGETGRYETTIVGDETVRAFVPAPLPPTPVLLQGPLEKALLALGRLDSFSVLLPDAHLFLLFQEDQAKIQQTGRAAGSALRVHQALQEHPIASIQELANRTELSVPAVTAGIQILERVGVVRELTGKKRNRLFGYEQYLAILGEGTELP